MWFKTTFHAIHKLHAWDLFASYIWRYNNPVRKIGPKRFSQVDSPVVSIFYVDLKICFPDLAFTL